MFQARKILLGIYLLLWPPLFLLLLYQSHDAQVFDRWSRRLFQLILGYSFLLAACTIVLGILAKSERGPRPIGIRLLTWIRASRWRYFASLAAPVVLWITAVFGVILIGPAAELANRLIWVMLDLAIVIFLWGWLLLLSNRDAVTRRYVLIRLLVVILGCVLGIGMVEIGGRLFEVEPISPWDLNPPNLSVDWVSDEFETHVITNSQGLREAKFIAEKHPGTFRIVVIGDSITFGQGVNEKETYPRVLEQQLREKSGWKNCEVVNVSRRGAGPGEYLRYLRLAIRKLNPDLIVLGFYTLNDCPVRQPYVPRNAKELEKLKQDILRESQEHWLMQSVGVRLVYRRAFLPAVRWRANLKAGAVPGVPDKIFGSPNELGLVLSEGLTDSEQQRYERLKSQGWIDRGLARKISPALMVTAIERPRILLTTLHLREDTNPGMAEEWQLCEELLSEMNTLAKSHSTSFWVLVIPHPYQVDPKAIEQLREWNIATSHRMLTTRKQNDLAVNFCKRNAIPVVDPLPAFRDAEKTGQPLFYPIDSHCTPFGHRLLAEELSQAAGRV